MLRPRREGWDLYVELAAAEGAAAPDHFRVTRHDTDDAGKVERLRLEGAEDYYDIANLNLADGAAAVSLESQTGALVSAMAPMLPSGSGGAEQSAPVLPPNEPLPLAPSS